MCNLHNIFCFRKTGENKSGKVRRRKMKKKCRIEAEIRQEKGLHHENLTKMCSGNDTDHSFEFCQLLR